MERSPASRKKLSTSVLKALGVFGTLELLKVVCSVARTKLVALWIGAAGVGVISLYNATLEMIRSVAMLNLRQSSVPSIDGTSDVSERAHIVRSVDLLGLIIGIIATIVVMVLSPVLSYLTFGSYDYSWGFALLAPTMLANSITDARSAILQGLGRLKLLARCSFYAVLTSTLVAIPLFYFFRMAAIVPVLLIFPIFTVLFLIFIPGSDIRKTPLDTALFRDTVKSLVRLGSYLTVGIGLGFAAEYILRAWLSWNSGVDTVGLFQAGYTIVKSYVGLFFTAITMEFFPRLSATIRNRRYTSIVVAHEIIISLWLLMPVVVALICFDEIVVKLLYSSSFLDAVPYISIAIIGTLLRAVSWCFSYVIVAKGDGKIYIFTESVSAVSLLVFSWFGWTLWGFEGLGLAYLAQYTVFTLATWLICNRRYGLRMPVAVGCLTALSIGCAAVALALRVYVAWWAVLPLLVPVALVSFVRIKRSLSGF